MTARPERAEGRVRHRPHLLVRGRQARGDHRLRRRPGEPGSRLPRRSRRAVRREAGDPGEAERHRLRRQADVGRFTFTDAAGHVYPPQAEAARPGLLLPGADLPPRRRHRAAAAGRVHGAVRPRPGVPLEVAEGHDRAAERPTRCSAFKLERWINPADYGFYSGDHHIHAAGCAHYTNPTEGVLPEDMFLHVKGEGLNVGCCLTWGPCYDFQRQFFEPTPHKLSEPFTVLKYDVEVSRLRLAGARPRLPAEPARPDLPRLGRDEDQGLADLDDAADAVGQGARRGHRLRPLRQRPRRSTPTQAPQAAARAARHEQRRRHQRGRGEGRQVAAARAVRERSTPTATAS